MSKHPNPAARILHDPKPALREEMIRDGVILEPTPAKVRTPCIADRRAISELLEATYDVGLGKYTKAWSDQRLGEKLDMPWAWVTDVRTQFFGADGGNEVSDVRAQQIASLTKEIAEVRAEHTRLGGTLGRLEGALERLKTELGL